MLIFNLLNNNFDIIVNVNKTVLHITKIPYS